MQRLSVHRQHREQRVVSSVVVRVTAWSMTRPGVRSSNQRPMTGRSRNTGKEADWSMFVMRLDPGSQLASPADANQSETGFLVNASARSQCALDAALREAG